MKVIIQRVSRASVEINSSVYSSINGGMVIFLGIKKGDKIQDVDKFVDKILKLRIFEDSNGKMNLPIRDVQGEILIISQFTLYADTKHGNRPSFFQSETPILAEKIYNQFVNYISETKIIVKTGQFGAMMNVNLVNNGPVTIEMENI